MKDCFQLLPLQSGIQLFTSHFENLMVQGIVKVFILVYNKNVDKIMIKF